MPLPLLSRGTGKGEVVPEYSFKRAIRRMDWRPGEHVTLIGPTGRGKTELLIALMDLRQWGVFVSTKRRDSTQAPLVRMGFRPITDPAEVQPEVHGRYLFQTPWPKGVPADELKNAQRATVGNLLIRLRDQGGYTVGLDEVRYLTQTLGLASELEVLWLQGRSEGTSLIANTQRPRFIPLEAYSQATHLFFWTSPDLQDVARIGEMAAFDRRLVTDTLQDIQEQGQRAKHDVLYVNTVTGDTFVTNRRW